MLGLSNNLFGSSSLTPYSEWALSFDGVDDYVSFGDLDIFTPNNSGANRGFSMSFWVKTPGVSEPVFSKAAKWYSGSSRYEYKAQINFEGKLKFYFYSGQSQDHSITFKIQTPLSFNEWHHVVLAWDLGTDPNSFQGHIDGIAHNAVIGNAEIAETGTFVSVDNSVAPLDLVKHSQGYGNIMLDEFALFDDVLSDAQAISIYSGGSPGDLSSIPHLIGWWRCGDSAGPSVYPTLADFSSNSNTGEMINMDTGDIVSDTP